MEVTVTASDPANPTTVAMKHLLLHTIIVPEVASLAEVTAKHLTTSTALPSRRLSSRTLLTDHLADLRAIDLMRTPTTALFLVVTVSAPERFSTTRCDDATASSVVPTATPQIATGWSAASQKRDACRLLSGCGHGQRVAAASGAAPYA